MPYSDKHKLIFIHIPKNAGTAITNALEMNDIGHHSWKYYKNKYPEKWNTYTKIAVIRNPWDRVVSNYAYARMEESHWHSVSGKTRYSKHPDLELLKDKSFEECISILKNNPSSLKHRGWSLQKDYITDDNHIVIDIVILQEDINTVINRLTNVNVSKINTSKRDDYKTYYNQDLIETVGEIYKEDIKLFNFKYE